MSKESLHFDGLLLTAEGRSWDKRKGNVCPQNLIKLWWDLERLASTDITCTYLCQIDFPLWDAKATTRKLIKLGLTKAEHSWNQNFSFFNHLAHFMSSNFKDALNTITW